HLEPDSSRSERDEADCHEQHQQLRAIGRQTDPQQRVRGERHLAIASTAHRVAPCFAAWALAGAAREADGVARPPAGAVRPEAAARTPLPGVPAARSTHGWLRLTLRVIGSTLR